MKISFSTLGCPNWKWNEILSAAKDLGYDGIELRGLGEDLFLPDVKLFDKENRAKTRSELENLGLEIPCISTECFLHNPDVDFSQSIIAYLDLAKDMGSTCIRVMGERSGEEPSEGIDIQMVASRLKSLAPEAEKRGVMILVETNGVFAKSERLKALLEAVASPYVQALWDIHHPFRYFGESPAETCANIGKYIRHVHVKDSKVENGRLVYKMLGYGDLPLKDAVKALKENGYAGFVSLEWLKRWNAELEDPGVVFSHFAYAVRQLIKKA